MEDRAVLPPVRLRRPPAILSCLSDRSERHTPAKGEFHRPGGGFLCPRRQRNQNAVFSGPFGGKHASGGQALSGCPLPFRATGPWRGGGWGLSLSPGPPGLCHAVSLGDKRRAAKGLPYNPPNTCAALWAKSRAPATASVRVLPCPPTSTSRYPGDSCWL